MRARINSSEGVPFFGPNASQARLHGRGDHLTKKPPPAMKFSGAWSLNRRGSPGWRTRKARPPLGCQKLTSSTPGSELKNRNQSLSVTATKAFTARGSLSRAGLPVKQPATRSHHGTGWLNVKHPAASVGLVRTVRHRLPGSADHLDRRGILRRWVR